MISGTWWTFSKCYESCYYCLSSEDRLLSPPPASHVTLASLPTIPATSHLQMRRRLPKLTGLLGESGKTIWVKHCTRPILSTPTATVSDIHVVAFSCKHTSPLRAGTLYTHFSIPNTKCLAHFSRRKDMRGFLFEVIPRPSPSSLLPGVGDRVGGTQRRRRAGLVAQHHKGRDFPGSVESSQMVKSPAAHTPTSGGGGWLNVKNESTISQTTRSTNKKVMGRETNRV